ncbi:MAG: DNA repair protein RecO, partial [Terriglobia bacterium]
FLPEREINDRAFRLWLAVLRAIKHSREVERPLLYFNYWLLRLGGFLPSLAKCAGCGRALEANAVYYGADPEGVFCADCRPGAAARTASPAAMALLSEARQRRLDEWMAAPAAEPAVSRQALRLLETWVASRAEGNLVTLQLLAADR